MTNHLDFQFNLFYNLLKGRSVRMANHFAGTGNDSCKA